MPNPGGILRTWIAALGLVAFLAACSPVYQYHGFVPTEEDLAEIEVGLDTRTSVASVIGKPGTFGLLADSGWYYVRSEFKHELWKAPEEITREVVAISFDEGDVVTNIERFGLEKGQVVVLNRRVTTSNIEGVSFLKQLFGSAGGLGTLGKMFGG